MPYALIGMLTFDQPAWFWALLALPGIVLACWRSRENLGRGRWLGALGLRCGVFLALIATLAEPQYVRRSDGVTVVFALDRSRSIPDEFRRQAEEYVKTIARKAHQGDRFGVVSFDGQAQVDAVPASSGPEWFAFSPASDPDRSDPAAAIRMATALFPPDTARRIVLLTDGNENQGSLLSEVESAAANGTVVDVIPLEYDAADEMLLDRLVVPPRTSPNSRIHLRVIIRSLRPARARLVLYHNDTPIPLDNPIIELKGGMRPEVLSVPVELLGTGVHRFEARLSPEEGSRDTIAENNRAGAFTIVEARGRVLVLDQSGSTDNRPLVQALTREQIDVTHKQVDEFSVDLLHLQEYDTVILGNISADTFNEDQHRALASYVKDLGGGLILLGGDEAFGAGGWTGKPIEEVSPVSFSIPSKKVLPVAALVIVLDHSGSMGSPVGGTPRTQQQIANEAAILALKTLLPRDYLGLVAFDTRATWVVPLQTNANQTSVATRVRGIGPGGGTDAYPALEAAAEALEKIGRAASVKHVLLLTDGQTQPAPFEQLVGRMSRHGITLSTIGVGDGMNDPMLRRLAELGGGVFHPVRDPRTLPQIFFRETRVIRKRLISEEPFTPRAVAPFSPLLAGVSGDHWPELDGFVLTLPKPDALLGLVHPKEGPGAPILAYWHYEMGKVMAFTSGWWPRWGEKWAAWESFGAFWKSAVEWVGGDREADGLEVTTRLDGTTGQVVVEAIGRDGAYLNSLDIGGMLVTPRFESRPLKLTQTGPGQYEARFDAHERGDYLISLRARGSPEATGVVRTGLTVPYSPEYRELRADSRLLEQAVEKGRGKIRWLSDQDDPFERDLPPVHSRTPIWKWMLACCLLPLFLTDVAVRRLASVPALSFYAEAGVLTMLIGLAWLTEAGAAGYVASFVLAEAVGWPLRWRWFRSAVHDYLSFGPVPVPSTGAMAVLHESKKRAHEDRTVSHSERRSSRQVRPPDAGNELDQVVVQPIRESAVCEADPIAHAPAQTRPTPSREPASADETANRLLRVKQHLRQKLASPDDDRPPDAEPEE
ncbi:MAG TPA: VWA domain-containing protein [Phycisphaerae bacterium]|nr:VWA domain-containing protein [Phycisphaerae bacterium]HOJ54614.1 VWA domain-containing protein [Phycisphaerae bacterium]